MESNQNPFITNISKYRSAIMGFALLSIMLFHQPFTNVIPFNFFHTFGFWGVDVFLFLSGMGLVNSLENHSIITYYKRRFNRLIPSCVVCGTTKYLIFLLFSHSFASFPNSVSMVLWTFVSLYSWFVFTIIILYVTAPVIYWLLLKVPNPTIICIITVFFVNGLILRPVIGNDWMSLGGIISWTTERLPVFVFGMFIAIKKYDINNKMYISYVFLLLAILISSLANYDIYFTAQQTLSYFSLTIGIPSLITLILSLLKKIPTSVLKPFLFLGYYSFEIYIFDAFYFRDLKIDCDITNPLLLLPIYFILTCVSAYLCKQLVIKIPSLK